MKDIEGKSGYIVQTVWCHVVSQHRIVVVHETTKTWGPGWPSRPHLNHTKSRGSSRWSKNSQYDWFGSSIWQRWGPFPPKPRQIDDFLTKFWQAFDKLLTTWFSGSSKACLFRHQRGDGFGWSKICRLDNFLTSFSGPRSCVTACSRQVTWWLVDWVYVMSGRRSFVQKYWQRGNDTEGSMLQHLVRQCYSIFICTLVEHQL